MKLARKGDDPAVEDAGLDLLTAVQLRIDDIPAAVATERRRDVTIASLPR